MTREEMFAAAKEARPDLMAKTAHVVKLLDKLAPEFVPDVMQDFSTITDTTTEKIASAPGWAGFGAALGGTLLAGLGTAIASDLYDAARRGLTKGTNFRRILQANPELKEYPKDRLKASFETLHRYGPEFTADPLMGGSLLKAVAGLEGNEHTLVEKVLQSRKNLVEAKGKQFHPGNIQFELRDNEGFRQKVELEKAKASISANRKPDIQYHQHFHGSKSQKGKPLALKNNPNP